MRVSVQVVKMTFACSFPVSLVACLVISAEEIRCVFDDI